MVRRVSGNDQSQLPLSPSADHFPSDILLLLSRGLGYMFCPWQMPVNLNSPAIAIEPFLSDKSSCALIAWRILRISPPGILLLYEYTFACVGYIDHICCTLECYIVEIRALSPSNIA